MMMKSVLPYLLAVGVWIPVCFGSIRDVPETADGRLVTGEYANLSVTLEGYEELYVMGGGI